MIGIFISYRRDDAAAWAGRLYDHLAERFGADNVFMDIDDILPGADFRDAIDRTLEHCGVLLAVVGPHWLDSVDASGQRRLDNENDYLRMEIARALGREGRVIPVLVDGAPMPTPEQLPAPLAELAYRQAFELSPTHFRRDAAALADFVAEHLAIVGRAGETATPSRAEATPPATTSGVGPAATPAAVPLTAPPPPEPPVTPPRYPPTTGPPPMPAGVPRGGDGSRHGILRAVGIFVLLLLLAGGGIALYAVYGGEEQSTPTTEAPPERECEIPLEFGDTCDLVRDLQQMLNEHYADTAVDGEFGPGTRAAVIEFQECRQLPIPEDELGVVDQLTWDHLEGPFEECRPAGGGDPDGGEGSEEG